MDEWAVSHGFHIEMPDEESEDFGEEVEELWAALDDAWHEVLCRNGLES